jgi:hypothetical protein
MPVVAITRDLNKKRPILNCILLGPFKSFSNFKHIVPFDFQPWYLIATSILVYIHRRSLHGGAHPITVVLADK